MARRKDHSPETLRSLIAQAGKKIIQTKGLEALTARAVARAVGYSPGTIYNLFRDLDALVLAVNYETLGMLREVCETCIVAVPHGIARIRVLAHAYIDFAVANPRLWLALFAQDGQPARPSKLPGWYHERLADLFEFLERNLQQSLNLSAADSQRDARLFWACMHGITTLKLDGRLRLAGITDATSLTDAMLARLFGGMQPKRA